MISYIPSVNLQAVAKYLPVALRNRTDNDAFSKVAFEEHEREDIINRASDVKNGVVDQRMDEVRHYGNAPLAWDWWIGILSGTLKLSDFDASFPDRLVQSKIKEYAQRHFAELRNFVFEMMKLRREVPKVLKEIFGESQGKEFPKEHWLNVGLSQISLYSPFGDSGKTSEVYQCYTLTGLIALELVFLQRSKNRVGTCKLCGNYFSAASSQRHFCNCPNPDYDGNPCEKVGPYLQYRERTKNTPVFKEYDKQKKAYHRWMRVSLMKLERLQKHLCDSGDEAEADRVASTIREISDNYIKWTVHAQEVLDNYECGNIKEADALEKMKIPAVWERSETYEDLRLYWKEEGL